MLKILNWNINSINARLNLLELVIKNHNPDIILLQETKCINEKFPTSQLSHLPYNFYIHGQKSYNGVAILSKIPGENIKYNFKDNPCENEARFIEISINIKNYYFQIISLYAPNGSAVGSEKFDQKLEFYDALYNYLESSKSFDSAILLGGDFNIAPFAIDVYSEQVLASGYDIKERRKMRYILNTGFYDLFRLANKGKVEFSWWDYRAKSFEHNKGMRIDGFLSSALAAQMLDSCIIDQQVRSLEKSSDHAPVIASFSIN